jgi:hypothetical protein
MKEREERGIARGRIDKGYGQKELEIWKIIRDEEFCLLGYNAV